MQLRNVCQKFTLCFHTAAGDAQYVGPWDNKHLECYREFKKHIKIIVVPFKLAVWSVSEENCKLKYYYLYNHCGSNALLNERFAV